jgi:sulfhydrogenase subunit beta (sulfur reductase)
MLQLFLSQDDFSQRVLKFLKDSIVIAPVAYQGRKILQVVTPETVEAIDLSGFRAVEPFKSHLFPLTEQVAKYFGGGGEPEQTKKIVFIGARGCDLEALDVYDKVIGKGEYADPCYLGARRNMLVIGADCTACGRTCFCTMVGGQPFPTRLYDLNLTPVSGGFVVETRVDKEWELARDLREATAEQAAEKEAVRKKTLAALAEVNLEYTCRCSIDWKDAHKMNLENQKAWKEVTKKCVECSACNFICPTCTCFLLLDSRGQGPGAREEYSRHKVWDACLKTGYARVAGGANSRPKLYERLQNRYHCKFDYSFDRLERYTCVGCGRCIDACAGNIDMREVYAELVRQVPLTAKLE